MVARMVALVTMVAIALRSWQKDLRLTLISLHLFPSVYTCSLCYTSCSHIAAHKQVVPKVVVPINEKVQLLTLELKPKSIDIRSLQRLKGCCSYILLFPKLLLFPEPRKLFLVVVPIAVWL